MLNKKGMWTWGTALRFIVFYVPMTAVVVLLLLQVPNNILNAQIYVGELDATFLSNRAFQKLSYTDPVTGRLYQGQIQDTAVFNKDLIQNMFYFHKQKQSAFNFTLGKKSIVLNKPFYEIGRPLTSVYRPLVRTSYMLLISKKEMQVLKDKKIIPLTIEQVSTRKLT